MTSLFRNQPVSSKGSREGQRQPEADRHIHSTILSAHRQAKITRWKCVTDIITDLVVDMKFVVLPSLQWPVQIGVTLHSVILQDVAPGRGETNGDYADKCIMQTAGFNYTAPGQMRSQIGNDMQNSKQCSLKRIGEYLTRRERSLGWSCHGNFLEGRKELSKIFLSSRTCWLLHFCM